MRPAATGCAARVRRRGASGSAGRIGLAPVGEEVTLLRSKHCLPFRDLEGVQTVLKKLTGGNDAVVVFLWLLTL